MSEDGLIFLAAVILLAQNVGNRVEPADENQLRIAVTNAQNLHEAVKKRPADPAKQVHGLTEHLKHQAGKS